MEINISEKINATPSEVWSVFKDPTCWEAWYGVAMEEAHWTAGGYLRYAAHDGIKGGTIPLTDYREAETVTLAGPWADDTYSVRPAGAGSIFSKQVRPKNGATFTAGGYSKESREQQEFLRKFREIVETTYPVTAGGVPGGGDQAAQLRTVPPGGDQLTGMADPLTPKQPLNKKLILSGGIALAVLLAGIGIPISNYNAKAAKYNEGSALINQGDYQSAYGIFESLKDFKDSADWAAYAQSSLKYNEAAQLLGNGQYSKASGIFDSLGDFNDSAKLADYARGKGQLEKADYKNALTTLTSLGGFKDSSMLADLAGRGVKYQEAAALLDQGDFADALVIFTSLGGFKDAAAQAAYAQQGIKYKEGTAMLEAGDYANASAVFDGLGVFNDASDKAAYAKQGIKYSEALALMDRGQYSEAMSLLGEVPDFKDAKQRSAECQAAISYVQGKALYDAGDYAGAAEAFTKAGAYQDAVDLAESSRQYQRFAADYAKAVELKANGQAYAAYKAFIALGNFKDSPDMAAHCPISKPDTGETYRNSAYGGSDCTLTIEPIASAVSCTYFKIYSSNEATLVSCIFMKPGQTASIGLPAGSYVFKEAYSDGDWFGETDMFGSNGTYQRLKSSSLSDIFSLVENYEYTLTLQTADPSGKKVYSKNEDQASF